MIIALYAAAAMFVQDVLGVLLVQAEARNKASLAALADVFSWLAFISTTAISVTALQGHSLALKAVVIASVTAANVAGSYAGVGIGKRWIRNDNATQLTALTLRVADLERKLGGTEVKP